MDRVRLSFIAHTGLPYFNPVCDKRIESALSRVPWRERMSVIDIGSGAGQLLIKLVEQHNVHAIAVERESIFVDEMHKRMGDHIPAHAIVIHQTPVAEFLQTHASDRYDVVVCIGAGHAFGGEDAAMRRLAGLVMPGGYLIFGAGYWKQTPAPEYLASFGGTVEEMGTHSKHVEVGVSLGLTPLFATTASNDEWDEYEWRYATNIENYVAANPNDPDSPAMLARCRSWRAAYLRWGRDTMGFGVYVFRKPV